MAQAIDRRGLKSISEGFDLFDTPYYALIQGGEIKYVSDDEDVEAAKQLLIDNLTAAYQAGSDAMYTIRFYKAIPDGGIDKKTGYIGSFNCKVQDTPVAYTPWQQVPQQVNGNNTELQEMKSKIAKLEEREQVQEFEPPEPPPPGILETFLQNPQMAVATVSGIIDLVKDLFRPKAAQQVGQQQQQQLYEIPDGAISEEEIELLNYYRGLDPGMKAFLKSQVKK